MRVGLYRHRHPVVNEVKFLAIVEKKFGFDVEETQQCLEDTKRNLL
jgi:hypothetical protein